MGIDDLFLPALVRRPIKNRPLRRRGRQPNQLMKAVVANRTLIIGEDRTMA